KSVSSRIVTTVFRVGQATLASFQNSSSVGRTSGSDAMPRRISASLMWRILKCDSMANDIAAVLLSVPTITHNLYLHNVNTHNGRQTRWNFFPVHPFAVSYHRSIAISSLIIRKSGTKCQFWNRG